MTCYDCKKRYKKGGDCGCPILPVTTRFYFKNKRSNAYAIDEIKFIKQDGRYRLFVIAGVAVIEDLESVENGRREGEYGFDELLSLLSL